MLCEYWLIKSESYGSNPYRQCWNTDVFLWDCIFIGPPCTVPHANVSTPQTMSVHERHEELQRNKNSLGYSVVSATRRPILMCFGNDHNHYGRQTVVTNKHGTSGVCEFKGQPYRSKSAVTLRRCSFFGYGCSRLTETWNWSYGRRMR